MFGADRRGDTHQRRSTPSYAAVSGEMITAVGTAALLQVLTVLAMVALANSPAAIALQGLFQTPILGVIVVGIGLTAGRYLGMRGLAGGNLVLASVGIVLSIATYGVLGGAILSPYAPAAYAPAIGIATLITVAIAAVAAIYVYSRDAKLDHWAKYSSGFFLVGIGAAVVGTFFPPVLLLAFLCFLLGFLADLVYEIYRTGRSDRSPLVNGFGLYVAFAGIFVHVLQLVLRMLADR